MNQEEQQNQAKYFSLSLSFWFSLIQLFFEFTNQIQLEWIQNQLNSKIVWSERKLKAIELIHLILGYHKTES